MNTSSRRPKLSDCSEIRKETVGATRGNGQEAPIRAIRVITIGRLKLTRSGHSRHRPTALARGSWDRRAVAAASPLGAVLNPIASYETGSDAD